MSADPDRTCVVVRPDRRETTAQGLLSFAGISRSAGAERLCLHLIIIPPGGRARAHLHRGHETALYVLEGAAGMWFGRALEDYVEVRAGEFLNIPADTPHQPFNLSETESARAIGARTDPEERESVVLLPHLDRPPPTGRAEGASE